jgi:hypothetical protein
MRMLVRWFGHTVALPAASERPALGGGFVLFSACSA